MVKNHGETERQRKTRTRHGAGIWPGRNHEITLSLETGEQETYLQTFQHVTPALPENQSEFPLIDVIVSQPERMEPGITYLTLRRRALGIGRTRTERQRSFTTGWGKVIAIDHRGDVVWWFETDSRVAGIERLLNGNILIQRVTSSMLEIDLLGNIIAEYYAEKTPDHPTGPNAIKIQGIDVLHHQPHQMSTGDFLAFSAYATVFEDWYTSDADPLAPRDDVPVMVDELIQYDP